MKRTFLLALAACFLAVAAPSVSAQKVALGLQVGTMGPGIQAHINVNEKLNVRAGGNFFSYSRTDQYTDESEGITLQADSDINLGSMMAVLDFHPTGGAFRLTGGLFYNGNDFSTRAFSLDDYEFSDTKTFSAERLGTLSGDFQWPNWNPYLGLGIGNGPGKAVSFQFDLGVLYTGSPTMDLEGTGFIGPTANQDKDINEGIESFQFYPYLSLGFGVRVF